MYRRDAETQRIFENGFIPFKLLSGILIMVFLCASASLRFNMTQAQELKPRDGEVRAAWIHTYAPFDWDVEMARLAAAGFNAVFVRAARGANAIYPSQVLARDDWAINLAHDELQKAIDAAHRNGLEFHFWKVCFHVGGASKQKGEARKLYDEMARDDRLARGPDGVQAPFLNPADPRNQELELAVAREVIEKYNVDGYHLDYIRYPELPHYDFDYGEVSRREFEKYSGQPVPDWPRAVISGDLKWKYENWERENINGLVKNISAQIRKLKPEVQVSAAVWRAHRLNRAALKQDWIHWANNGWLDFVVPMNYTEDAAQFEREVRAQVPNAAGRILFLAGIGAYKHKEVATVLKQIQIARENGADGFVLFDYKPQKYEALLNSLRDGAHSRNTNLPYRAPRVAWNLSAGIERKDAPPLFQAGTEVSVQVTPFQSATMKNIIGGQVRLETQSGRWINWPGKIESLEWPLDSWSTQVWKFVVPPGVSRVVMSGTLETTAGVFQPFIVRGPMLEGLESAEYAAQSTRLQPPADEGPLMASIGKRVAVYEGGLAASGVLKVLEEAAPLDEFKVNPVAIPGLQSAWWKSAGVLVLPQLRDVAELTPEVVASLRDWVQAGGVLVLTHDAAGYRWHARMFPEIGQGVGLSKNRDVEVLENAFGLTPGAWRHAYPDHVVIEPGPQGIVLARETAGDKAPVLVGGSFGKGKVFLYGALLGYAPDGKMDEGERRLLLEICR